MIAYMCKCCDRTRSPWEQQEHMFVSSPDWEAIKSYQGRLPRGSALLWGRPVGWVAISQVDRRSTASKDRCPFGKMGSSSDKMDARWCGTSWKTILSLEALKWRALSWVRSILKSWSQYRFWAHSIVKLQVWQSNHFTSIVLWSTSSNTHLLGLLQRLNGIIYLHQAGSKCMSPNEHFNKHQFFFA